MLAGDEKSLTVASVRDITRHRERERALQASNERERRIVESVSDYAIFALDVDGHVSTWNGGAERINGYQAKDVLGANFALFYPAEERSAGTPRRHLEEAATEGHTAYEGWRLRKDGSRFWATVVVSAMHDADGRLMGFSKITRDVTEERLTETRIAALLTIAQAVLSGHPDAVPQLVASLGRQIVDADDGLLLIPDDDQSLDLSVRGFDGHRTSALSAASHIRWPPGPFRHAQTFADLIELSGIDPQLGVLSGPGIAVPLDASDRLLGMLLLTRRPGRARMTQADVDRLRPFASQVAIVLQYMRMRQELEAMVLYQDRQRIGRELHDGAIQTLFAAAMGLHGLMQMSPTPVLRKGLDQAVLQIDEVIRSLRDYVFALRVDSPGRFGLEGTLRRMAARVDQESGITCVVDADPALAARLGAQSGDIEQIVRESLSNVARHAQATTCRVGLREDGEFVSLIIDDDGAGFDPAAVDRAGWGLRNLHERATALGGTFELTSQPGEGTTVTIRFPVPEDVP